jgi:hypothetical protein
MMAPVRQPPPWEWTRVTVVDDKEVENSANGMASLHVTANGRDPFVDKRVHEGLGPFRIPLASHSVSAAAVSPPAAAIAP